MGIFYISFILLIIYSILAINEWNKKNIIILPSLLPKCEPAFNTLPDVSSLPCCIISGNTTSSKYYPALDMVISNFPTSYLEACNGFCTSGVDTQNNSLCINGIGQTQYTQCINNIYPKNCVGIANPIGVSGSNYYYATSATNQSCLNTTTC